jgi:hypothetical protein
MRYSNNPYSNNPYSVFGVLVSSHRNMYLSSTIAITIIGFSDTFTNEIIKTNIKIFGLIIFMISIYTGISASNQFSYYLNKSKNLPDNIPIKSWKRWQYISYLYSLLITCIAVLFLNRKLVTFNYLRNLKNINYLVQN